MRNVSNSMVVVSAWVLLASAVAGAQDPAATPPPAAAAPTDATATAAPALTADEAFTTRVKTLEEQVVDLKEKIFRTKARLLLLQETVLGGDLSQGARAVLEALRRDLVGREGSE